ncbi:hypothetical protein GCM10023347_46510 [Streptomyces chumphonensis]|uniref:Restriction endonuclease subunit S n=1 Tax=Streptomyces chumphonensis TaxID=1214925 RepID=A0A927F0E1_9ACTN|nr:restriction endonuclease subunit S [Streptomyces chumphonensis]MBD3932828.1 restriction endonuclease subunit S [Streptomyces chumphonensis]
MPGKWPTGWRSVALGDTGTWLSGGTPSTSRGEYWGGNIPWISAASLKNFRVSNSDRTVTELGAKHGTRLVDRGAVIFVVRGMSLKSELRVGVTEERVAFGQDCKAIVVNDEIDPYFLAHTLQSRSHSILAMVEETSHGTGRLDTTRLQELQIGVPPTLDEQRRIVAVHAAAERRIESLKRTLGKLTIVESATVSEIFSQSMNWPTARLERLADVSAGVTLGSDPTGEDTIELPYLRVANVLDGRIDTSDVKKIRIPKARFERFALRPGDLLLTEGGDLDKLGRGAVWDGRLSPCLHQNHIFRVRCGNDISPEFLALYTASAAGRAYFQSVGSQTTNLASINSTQVKSMPVPFPARSEQERLLRPIEIARARTTGVQAQLAKLRRAQRGLVEDLLCGNTRT